MLAPLKNRHLIEREPADSFELLEQACLRIAQLEGEKIALKLALRDLCQVHRRHKMTAAGTEREMAREADCLHERCEAYRQRLEKLESGESIVELGRKLIALEEKNTQLENAAQNVWYLDKTLCAAHCECERLAKERDVLAQRLSAVENKDPPESSIEPT